MRRLDEDQRNQVVRCTTCSGWSGMRKIFEEEVDLGMRLLADPNEILKGMALYYSGRISILKELLNLANKIMQGGKK